MSRKPKWDGTVTRHPKRQEPKLPSRRKAIAGNQLRSAGMAPRSFDAEAGTFEAVFATATPVPRWYGDEVLEISNRAVDLSQMVGAPVLDTHDRRSIDSVIGRVERVWLGNEGLIGTIRLDNGERGEAAKRKIAGGMIRAVSVGYAVDDYRESKGRDGQKEVHVTRWRPFEVSLVPVPADPNAIIRSVERLVMDPEEEVMDRGDEGREDEGERARRRRGERERRFERHLDLLRSQAVGAGLAEVDVDDILADVRSIDEGRAAVFAALAERSRRTLTTPHRGDGRNVGNRAADELRERAVDAMTVRLGGSPSNENNPLSGASMPAVVRTLMEAAGQSTRGMDDRQVIDEAFFGTRAMHTTSDFPALLVEAGQRVLEQRFAAYQSPLKTYSRQRTVRDFRPASFIRPGEAPILMPLLESGEIQFGTLDMESLGIRVTPYARGFRLSRQSIVNDDLGAFADFNLTFAESAIRREAVEFFGVLSANSFAGASMADGLPMFHADRGNIAAAGAAPSEETLSAARQAMRLQKNVNKSEPAGTIPTTILVGPKLETAAEKLVATLSAAKSSDVNPFAGKLRVEVENQYDGNGWWLLADPTTRPALIHAYLDGFGSAPRVRIDETFGTQGMGFTCEHDFGCAPYDWRAAYFNPGAGD